MSTIRSQPRKPYMISVFSGVILVIAIVCTSFLWHSQPSLTEAMGNEKKAALFIACSIGLSALFGAGLILASIGLSQWVRYFLELPSTRAGLRWLYWGVPLGSCLVYAALIPALQLPFASATKADHGFATANLAYFGPMVAKALAMTNFILTVFGIDLHIRYNKAHRRAQQQKVIFDAAWGNAQRMAALLATGEELPGIHPPDLVLWPGERCFLDDAIDYARYYSMNVPYQHVSGMYFGPLPFVAAASLITMLGNRSRRERAIRLSRAQWRDQELVRVIITDHRMLIRRSCEWIEFSHDALLTFYPEPDGWVLVGEYRGTSALRLSGPGAPAACLLVQSIVHGQDSLEHHPAFRSLMPPPYHEDPALIGEP